MKLSRRIDLSLPISLTIFFTAASSLFGCGKAEEEINAATVAASGEDYSGSYRSVGFECYDNSGSMLTAAGTNTTGSASSTITLTRNTYESVSVSSSCTVRMSGSIVFTKTSETSSGHLGSVRMTPTSISLPGSSTCTLGLSWSLLSGSPSITPSSITTTWTASSPLTSTSADYIKNASFIAMTSALQVVGYPTDICFLIYQKL
jgi:hypothetical protein